jgi:hypothetical protein
MIQIPLDWIKGLADGYVQFKPIIQMGARLARQKIPKEWDKMLTDISTGNVEGMKDLQATLQGQQPPGQLGVPENKIGERVLAQDEAFLAWNLVRVQGYSYRDARDIMAEKYGVNCSHGTVKNYCDEIDSTMDEDRQLRKAGMYKALFFFIVTMIAGMGLDRLIIFLLRF